MKDAVIIPTWDRPELLWLSLDHLALCPEIKDVDVRIYVDRHANVADYPNQAEIVDIFKRFSSLNLELIWREPHKYLGNSFNVMAAYRELSECSEYRYVYLVEDDVMVMPDFFGWHRAVQATHQPFCSVGSKMLPGKNGTLVDGGILSAQFASIGCCFERKNLKEFVSPHANVYYWQDMTGYIGRAFPNEGRADQFTEQDGLIERIMSQHKLRSIWPAPDRIPVAFHVGYYGYHRWNGPRPSGSLRSRYEYVRSAMNDPERLRGLAKNVQDVSYVGSN